MRIVGIIAEYNPFHQGHAYQIKKVRELTQADFILVSMSGNLIQVLSLICALEASVEICLLLSGWLHFSLRNQQTINCICKMA